MAQRYAFYTAVRGQKTQNPAEVDGGLFLLQPGQMWNPGGGGLFLLLFPSTHFFRFLQSSLVN